MGNILPHIIVLSRPTFYTVKVDALLHTVKVCQHCDFKNASLASCDQDWKITIGYWLTNFVDQVSGWSPFFKNMHTQRSISVSYRIVQSMFVLSIFISF